MTKLEVDHVARPALPWRTEAQLTECGRPLERHEGRIISAQEFIQRIRDLGQQRAAYTTCMTCWNTVERWRSDLDDPITAVYRELYQITSRPYDGPLDNLRPDLAQQIGEDRERRERTNRELRALGTLVEAHREEFDELLTGLAKTVSLTQRRTRRRTT